MSMHGVIRIMAKGMSSYFALCFPELDRAIAIGNVYRMCRSEGEPCASGGCFREDWASGGCFIEDSFLLG